MRLMPRNTSTRLARRLVAVVLVLSFVTPGSATVTRADDEPPVGATSETTSPGPTSTFVPLPPLTVTPSTRNTGGATATPVPAPANNGDEKPSNGNGEKPSNGNDQKPTGTPTLPPAQAAPARPQAAACPPPTNTQATAWKLEGNDAINNMRVSIDATFKAVEARDLGVSGDIIGFRPGVLYAHIYARDSATMAPSAQYFYPLPYLTKPVEEFLALQYDGVPGDPEDAYWQTPGQPGAISGTIAGGEIRAAKMLVVSDEETSLITMAYVAAKAGGGAEWLRGEQAGKPRITRLNEAMDWLFAVRFDQRLRAIKRGNTTDWGDVVVGQGHTSGSYTKEPEAWTASIYDQAWAYRALQQLAELNLMVDQNEEAEHQLARARVLRQSVAERFWQNDRGYFRTRILVPPLSREIDEDSIVSIANGVAVYAGITIPQEQKPLFNALENARIQAGAPKPGLTLWPPYPLGFFDYPQMVPGRYQNGAVWDWWGGMQVSAEFWNGYSALGRKHIDQVAQDWAREPGEIYEWQETGTRKNLGSQAYAGAAATMAEAIISGLYGVEVGPTRWSLAPRLGSQSGGIHVLHPASGCTLDYWQTFAGDRMAVEWDTQHPNPGEVRVLMPDNMRVGSALLDQKPVQLRIEAVGDDVMAVLPNPAPSGAHRLEIRLVERTE